MKVFGVFILVASLVFAAYWVWPILEGGEIHWDGVWKAVVGVAVGYALMVKGSPDEPSDDKREA